MDSDSAKALAEGLFEAVGALYGCRYSEQPLAKKLDALLKAHTGQTYYERVLAGVLNRHPAHSGGEIE